MSTYPVGEEATIAQDTRRRDPAPARHLVALTRDHALTQSLEDLAASGIDISMVPDAEALAGELIQDPATTALVDADSLPEPIDVFVDMLTTQFPTLRLLVAGHSMEQNTLSTRIASGQVCRFVHKPASVQRLKIMVDAANRSADPQRITVTQSLQALPDIETGIRPRPAFARDGMGNRKGLATGLIGGIIVAAMAGGWLWLRQPDPATPPPTATGRTADVDPALAGLLDTADQAFAAARYVATDGSSAAEGYRTVLAQDPASDRARSGFERSVNSGLQEAEQALLAGRLDEAAGKTEALHDLVPDNSRLAFLQSQLDRERDRLRAEASQKASFEQRQARIQESLAQMRTGLQQGTLLEPAGDSALAHFEAAERIRAEDPAVRDGRDELLTALLNAADTELLAGRAPAARTYIDAAASLNEATPGLAPLRRRLDALLAQLSAPVQVVAPVPPATTATAPAPVASLAPIPAPALPPPPAVVTNAVVAATTLQRVSATAPEYPPQALRRLISGWVDLEFTITPAGTVQDITVVEAQPRNIFDAAAIAALGRWLFMPVLRDGVPVAQRARQRIRFSARDP